MTSRQTPPPSGQRLLALSGVAFAVLLALTIWSIVTSIARYRAMVSTDARSV